MDRVQTRSMLLLLLLLIPVVVASAPQHLPLHQEGGLLTLGCCCCYGRWWRSRPGWSFEPWPRSCYPVGPRVRPHWAAAVEVVLCSTAGNPGDPSQAPASTPDLAAVIAVEAAPLDLVFMERRRGLGPVQELFVGAARGAEVLRVVVLVGVVHGTVVQVEVIVVLMAAPSRP